MYGIWKKELEVNEKLLNKINLLCKFNKSKVEFKKGNIFKIKQTNLNILEPHRFIISVKEYKLIGVYNKCTGNKIPKHLIIHLF